MKRRLVLAISLVLILSLSVVSVASAEKEVMVDVCHRTGAGKYLLLNINGNALQAHIDHGDAQPGDLVPGMPEMMFDDDCSMVEVNANVEGTWEGASGLAGDLAYPFTMELTQDEYGMVTGTIDYGFIRYVSGMVTVDAFFFTTYDNEIDPTQPYYASCDPCMIMLDGTYIHGYGYDSNGMYVEFEAWLQ